MIPVLSLIAGLWASLVFPLDGMPIASRIASHLFSTLLISISFVLGDLHGRGIPVSLDLVKRVLSRHKETHSCGA